MPAPKRVRSLRVAIVGLALAAGAGCRPSRPASRVFPMAPVVLVSIDTLRSDHLPFYGGTGVETPALSRLREGAILFERAYSPVPLTLPAHLSVLTGRLPSAHGVHDNLGYRLKPDVPTLAELLKKRGYRTGAAVSAFVLGAASGAGRGFDFYDDGVEPTAALSAPSLIQRRGGESAAILERWIDAQGAAPFFAFLHVYEPHTPYEPAEPYRSRYAARPYDGEIATADAIVGAFLDHLRSGGLYDRALVVVLSDHGEGLGEHGEDEHGIFLYRSVLQVPLLVKLPGSALAGSSVSAPVQLTDVFGTIGRATGPEPFPESPGAVSLVDLAGGAKAPERFLYSESFFPRLHFGWADLSSALDGRWHYVDAPSPEFYDLSSDPGETRDLSAEKPGPIRAMALDLEKRRTAFAAPEALGEEDRKKLASLGYLSTGATPSGKPLDPKDEIGVVRELRAAMAAAAGGRPAEALPALERILAKSPSALDVHELYADALLAAGRPQDALAAARRAVELAPPGATLPLLKVATLCLNLGRPDDAIANARLALERGDAAAHEALARAYLAQGDLAHAEESATAALAVPRVRKRALLALAHVAVQRQDYAGAAARLAVIGNGDDLAGVHYLRGDVLARQGRFDAAVPEFEAEIRLFPRLTEAWVGLALTRSSQGRGAEARRLILEMVRTVGTPEAYDRAFRALTFMGAEAEAKRVLEEARRKSGRPIPGPR